MNAETYLSIRMCSNSWCIVVGNPWGSSVNNYIRPPEMNCSVFDRELLTLHFGVHHFRYLLEGWNFILLIPTTSPSVSACMVRVSDPWSNRQQRHLAYISEFTTDIHHIQGKDNHVADALSRAIINALHA